MSFKKNVATLIIAVMFLITAMPVFAQEITDTTSLPVPEKVEGEPDVGEAISPIKKGQKAPFTGVLVSPSAAAKITVELNNIPEMIQIEVGKEKKTCRATCDFEITTKTIELETDKKILTAQLGAKKEENKVLSDRVEKLEKNEPNIALWAGIGFVTGVAATILIVFATSATQNVTK